jgi:hypothetical protein
MLSHIQSNNYNNWGLMYNKHTQIAAFYSYPQTNFSYGLMRRSKHSEGRGTWRSCSNTTDLLFYMWIRDTTDNIRDLWGYQQWECNLAALWGQMSTGSGHAQLHAWVPVMTKKSFIQTDKDVGEWWIMRQTEPHPSSDESGQLHYLRALYSARQSDSIIKSCDMQSSCEC